MRLAVVPGDGIGPEVIAEALKVLGRSPGHRDDDLRPRRGTLAFDGELLPESVLTELAEHDAILLGAVGDPSYPVGSWSAGCCCGCASSWTTT